MRLEIGLFLFILAVALFAPSSVCSSEDATGGWQEEFDYLCSQVDIADSLSVEELRGLMERADKLMPVIQASDDPRKKVYIFRLEKCKTFFDYVIRMRQGG